MKGFYSDSVVVQIPAPADRMRPSVASSVPAGSSSGAMSESPAAPARRAPRECSARIAVYDGAGSAPRVEDIVSEEAGEFIEAFAARVYSLAREAGGSVPYTVVREIAENLVHADFAEPVASILDRGKTIRFSDQGPGIVDKDRALLPGFTTASGEAKRYIRGVGSGLPIVQDYVRFSGGSLLIEDNLGSGTVVTIRSGDASRSGDLRSATVARPASEPVTTSTVPVAGEALWPYEPAAVSAAVPSSPSLTRRQKQVLALVAETGGAGPSVVAKELLVGVSTAYRDLASLEDRGLLVSDDSGRRTVTELGLRVLETFMAS